MALKISTKSTVPQKGEARKKQRNDLAIEGGNFGDLKWCWIIEKWALTLFSVVVSRSKRSVRSALKAAAASRFTLAVENHPFASRVWPATPPLLQTRHSITRFPPENAITTIFGLRALLFLFYYAAERIFFVNQPWKIPKFHRSSCRKRLKS